MQATGTVTIWKRRLPAIQVIWLVIGMALFRNQAITIRNRKYYPIDTGLRRVVVTQTGKDRGRALECAVYLALRRRFGEVFYWRDRGEVDFVVHSQGRILPIQVSVNEPTERHHRAMDAFYERFPQADEAQFITTENFSSELDRLGP